MKRSWLVIALLLSIGVNIGILATFGLARARAERPVAGRSERWEGERGAPRIERLAERLKLDEESKEVFLEQHRQFFDSVQEVRRELGRTREELRREVGSTNPDRRAIDELLAESGRLNARLEQIFVDNVLATRELLDEQQQEAYLKLLRHRRDRGDRGRRRPGEGPPRPDGPPS